MTRPARPAAPEQDEFDKIDDEWLLFKNHVIEVKERVEKRQNEELEEAKLTIEALKRTNRELQNDLAQEEERNDELQREIDDLQDRIRELTPEEVEEEEKKEEETKEEPQPKPAVPARASPNRPTTLQKWIFCQYLLKVDPTKKIYNTFRNKWLGVTILAQRLGGDFLEDVDALNHQSIESLEGMIDRLKDLYEEHKHDEIKAALKYLAQAQIDFPNA